MRRPILFALTCTALAAAPLGAGTFERARIAPAFDLDALTRAGAREHLGRDLFANPYATVTLENVDVYDVFPYVETRTFQVVSDPRWHRLVYGEVGRSLRAYDGKQRPFGALAGPRGLAVDEYDRVYVADSGNDRILVLEARTEFGSVDLMPAFEITGLNDPHDVAFSDGGTPFVPGDDYVWVAETGANRVAAFAVTANGARPVATLGELGSGPGRFAGPLAIAAGRADGANSHDVFVADAHTRRIVRLRHEGGRLTWVGAITHDADVVTALDCDHWGNLYAAAPHAGMVRKYAPDLELVAELSDPLARPRGFHVPFRNVRDHRAGWLERTGRPNAVSVDQWGDATGIRLWDLGVEVRGLEIATPESPTARFMLTDQAEVTLELVDGASGRTLARQPAGMLPAGTHVIPVDARHVAAAQTADHVVVRVVAASGYQQGPSAIAQAVLRQTDAAPAQVAVLGITPNPMFASTRIAFAVPAGAEGNVAAGIHDAMGRRVRALSGPFAPGVNHVIWDGRGANGAPVPAGVYFFRLEAADVRRSQRLVVVR